VSNNNENLVFSFGEKGKDKWYAHADGVRIPCDESTIENLWEQWIMAPTADRADDGTYTIFIVTEPGLEI